MTTSSGRRIVSRSVPLPGRFCDASSPARRSPSGTTGAGSCAIASPTCTRSSASSSSHRGRAQRHPPTRRRAAARRHALLREPDRRATIRARRSAARWCRSTPSTSARRARQRIRSAKTPTAPCPGSCIATPIACCSSPPASARPTAATARAPASSAMVASSASTWRSGTRPSPTSRRRRAIRDVLLSGGDPLTLSDDRLEYLLTRLRRIPHVEFVRIGTKVPAVLPQRITPALTAYAQALPPAVDEHPLLPPRRAHARDRRGLRAAGRRGHSARQPDGAAGGHQRRVGPCSQPGARAAASARAALLPVPVRPDLRLVALPDRAWPRGSS